MYLIYHHPGILLETNAIFWSIPLNIKIPFFVAVLEGERPILLAPKKTGERVIAYLFYEFYVKSKINNINNTSLYFVGGANKNHPSQESQILLNHPQFMGRNFRWLEASKRSQRELKEYIYRVGLVKSPVLS